MFCDACPIIQNVHIQAFASCALSLRPSNKQTIIIINKPWSTAGRIRHAYSELTNLTAACHSDVQQRMYIAPMFMRAELSENTDFYGTSRRGRL